MCTVPPTWCGAQFIADHDQEACWTCQLLSMHISTLAYYNIDIRRRGWNRDGLCVAGGIDSQIPIVEAIELVNETWEPILI